MQSRKYLIAPILLIALSLQSCGALKTLTQRQESLEESARLQAEQIRRLEQTVSSVREDVSTIRTRATREVRIDSSAVVEVVTEVFDTTQPVDSVTGTPPLKERTTETRNVGTTRNETDAATSQTDTKSRQTEDIQTEAGSETTLQADSQMQSEAHTETTQKRGLNWWQKTLCGIGGATLALLLIWVIFQVVKHYLKPL